MNENKGKFLPIGSVIMLKTGKKRLMITGYVPIDMEKKDKVYDYQGCMYPEGVISTDKVLLFDHANIDKVYSIGYVDEEANEFLNKMKNTLTEENIKTMLENARDE